MQIVAQRAASRPAAPAVEAASAARVQSIDMLRGFALCGILLIHTAIFAFPGAPPGFAFAGPLWERLILSGLILFVDAKFVCLFAALFGVGFALQHAQAERRGIAFAPRFRRRLLVLGLIGAAHVALIWEGDILLLYAAVGLLLLPLRSAPTPRLLRRAALVLGIPLLLLTLAFGSLWLARLHPPSASLIQGAEAQFLNGFEGTRAAMLERYAGASFPEAARARVGAYLRNVPLLLTRMPAVLAMFLLGYALGRRGVLREVDQHLPLLRRARAWGLGAGLPLSLLVALGYATLSPFAAFTALAFNQVLAGPLLAVGYGAALLLLLRRPAWARLLAHLGAYGRMGLSNYLIQSLLCGLIFYGYGLGLVGEVTPSQALLLAVALNSALIAGSTIWLRRFRYGPAEWVWRSLTLGRVQPMRVAPRPTPPAPPRPVPLAGRGPMGERHRGRSFDARRSSGSL